LTQNFADGMNENADIVSEISYGDNDTIGVNRNIQQG
jgi:hypothetical protein